MTLSLRKSVRAMAGYRLSAHPCEIKLNQNESAHDLPDDLKKDVLSRLAAVPWNRYPKPFPETLCRKIAEKEGWTAEGVLMAGGSNILIQAILLASAVKGKVLTVSPSFSLYHIEAELLENRVVSVPLGRKDFSFPLEAFLKTLRRVRPQVVFLPNPNAPTGNLFPREDLVAVIAAAKKTGSLVVIDEAYYPFSGETLRDSLKEFRNLVIVRTFSKAFSLGGVRLGYLMADPEIVAEVRKCLLPFSVGILSQTVAEAVLDRDDYVEQRVREVLSERDILYKELCALPGLKVFPSQANFILFQSKDSKRLFNGLVAQGILIRDVSGPGLRNALRVSVGSPEENRRFLSAMAGIVS